jgi:hypothetical protein
MPEVGSLENAGVGCDYTHSTRPAVSTALDRHPPHVFLQSIKSQTIMIQGIEIILEAADAAQGDGLAAMRLELR